MTARARIIYNLWVCSTTMHSHLDALFYFGLKNIGCYEILCTACKNTKNPGVLGGSLQCRWILAGRVHCLICCSGRHQSAANPKWRLNTRKMKTTKTAYLGVAFFGGGRGGWWALPSKLHCSLQTLGDVKCDHGCDLSSVAQGLLRYFSEIRDIFYRNALSLCACTANRIQETGCAGISHVKRLMRADMAIKPSESYIKVVSSQRFFFKNACLQECRLKFW